MQPFLLIVAIAMTGGCSLLPGNWDIARTPVLQGRLAKKRPAMPVAERGSVVQSKSPTAVTVPTDSTAIQGTITINAGSAGTREIEIPQQGLNVGNAIQTLRNPDAGVPRLFADDPAGESELAVQLIRNNSSTWQPLFLAENTESRLTPLQDGDVVMIVNWKDTPLLKPSDDSVTADLVTEPRKNLEAAIHSLEKKSLPEEELEELRQKLENAESEGRNEDAARINSQLVELSNPGTIQRLESALALLADGTPEKETKQRELDDAKALLEKTRGELKALLKLHSIRYEITGLFQKPGMYTGDPNLAIKEINPESGALSMSGGQPANIIVLIRKNGNDSDTYILPYLSKIDGVQIPGDLAQKFRKLRSEAFVHSGDVFQFNQLRFLPSVLAGRMAKQVRIQLAALAREQSSRRTVVPELSRVEGEFDREPGAMATGFRRLRQRIPQLSIPGF